MRLIALLMLAHGLGSTPVFAQPALTVTADKPDPAKWFALKVEVEIEKTTYKTTTGVGSGTPIAAEDGKTLVLTNAHVIPSEYRDKPVTVYAKGKAYPARVLDGSKTETASSVIRIDGPDLCVLQVDADLSSVAVRTTELADGESVYYCGFGGHAGTFNPPARTGRVSTADSPCGTHLVFSGTPVQGDSGAGVFDANGKLVGVVWGGDTKTYAVPLKSVRRFVERPILTKLFPRAAARLADLKGVKEVELVPVRPLTPPAPDKKPDVPGVPKTMPGPGPTTVPTPTAPKK